ncbi:MAG: ATP-binding protein [Bacteroidales bacterium]|nr:ATP-binding protein [Bacteroidales bacterium]
MQRKIVSELLAWKNSKDRKPLILNGARQVGKTYTLETFAKENFNNVIYLNMEIETTLREFLDGDISPKRIIQHLELTKKQPITTDKTLIFFDEIQACERALTSLKYFCEQAPEYHVASAGSLLGVAVNREKYSFPVGKVDELYMFPLDFEEFLWALGYKKLANEIKNHFESNEPINTALHKLALDLYKKYLVVGGMPAAVKSFADTESFLSAQVIQNNIFNEYTADMSKYADTTTSVKIRACFNSVPAQLAKENRKFQYKIVQKGGTATLFGESIEWLNFAGTVLKCQKITAGNIPIAVYAYFPDFKLYMSDVGLLTLKSRLPAELLVAENNENNHFMGFVTENYVAQSLTANKIPLFYWKNDNTAEVDFVLQKGVNVIPIEVKRGISTRSKSMNLFAKQYFCPYSIRISQKNFGFENNIKSVPLYAVFCINN